MLFKTEQNKESKRTPVTGEIKILIECSEETAEGRALKVKLRLNQGERVCGALSPSGGLA